MKESHPFFDCFFLLADSMTHTVELNALCMKLGKKPIYKPIDPYQGMRPAFNYNIRAPGPYARSMQQYVPFELIRYHCVHVLLKYCYKFIWN